MISSRPGPHSGPLLLASNGGPCAFGNPLTSPSGYVKIRGSRRGSRVLSAREQLICFPHGQELSEGERLQLLWHIAVRMRLLRCKSGTV